MHKVKFSTVSMERYSLSKAESQAACFGAHTEYDRPPPNQPSPFQLIANSTSSDVAAMQKAETKAQFALLSDWDHLTSSEYRAIEEASGLDLFCVDSLLINGKGAVNCQPQSVLNALTPPPLLALLNGSTVSDRG